jgi:hypothetical protein
VADHRSGAAAGRARHHDILHCTPNDLIEIEAADAEVRKTAGEKRGPRPAVRRTSIRKPKGL